MLARRDSIHLGQILTNLIAPLAFDSLSFPLSLWPSPALPFPYGPVFPPRADLSALPSVRKFNFHDYINSKSILPTATLPPPPVLSSFLSLPITVPCPLPSASLNYREEGGGGGGGESLRVLQPLDTGINGNAVTHLSARYDSRRRRKIRSLENYTGLRGRVRAREQASERIIHLVAPVWPRLFLE